MINLENIKAFKERIESVGVPILSVYCDTDPSKDENKGMAWMIRIKNALKALIFSKLIITIWFL